MVIKPGAKIALIVIVAAVAVFVAKTFMGTTTTTAAPVSSVPAPQADQYKSFRIP
jgi:hypothetical protein